MISRPFASALALLIVLAGLTWPQPVQAHAVNYGALRSTLDIHDKQLNFHAIAPQQISVDAADQAGKIQLFEQYVSGSLTISAKSKPCPFKLTTFDNADPAKTMLDGVFTCQAAVTRIEDLRIESTLFADQFSNYDHFMSVAIGNKGWNLVFSPGQESYPSQVRAVPVTTDSAGQTHGGAGQFFSVAGQFIVLGITHIGTGIDHILFLLSIILLIRSLRNILILVTTFTLAHSVTLILAGLHIVTISPRIVEPLIALSIVYMAVRNIQILKKQKGKKKAKEHIGERRLTTGGFGLVHGLGFAGALLETHIPDGYVIPSLLFFNVGVEVGQLGILAILVPVLIQVDRLRQRRIILLEVSAIIVVVATVWFFQRVL